MSDNKIKSPVTGVVFRVVAQSGTELEAGATILFLESMKVEIPVTMPRNGRLKAILVNEGDEVTESQPVAEIE